jgi:hypothetical protein
MDPIKAILSLAKSFGSSPWLLGVLAILIPLLLTAGGFVLAWWLARRKKAEKPKDPPPVEVAGAPSIPGARLAPSQLRRAWLRFLGGLPPTHSRSILNFEHYVVFGAPSSGKTRIIDSYLDWRRQEKEFLTSLSVDADLQVYLGSWAVVTEIPARILTDYSEKCHRALDRLWRPLYERRSPTVVVVVDVARLRDSTPDEITDLAERMRGKINLLARIRGRAIETRVVLTHLDSIDGYAEFAQFSAEQGIPLRIPLEIGKDKPAPLAQVEAWLGASRGHIARALITMPTDRFRRTVAFVRNAPAMVPAVGAFLDTLFAREGLSREPVCGGIFLGHDGTCLPSPLRNAADKGRGPDPRIRHMIAAAGMAGALLGYLTFSCSDQHAALRRAAAALHDYEPNAVGSDGERARRAAILDFAAYRGGIFTRPDFYRGARETMRAQMSRELRDDLLVPRLRLVARTGAVEAGAPPLGWRRALYYLALIHSDVHDGMHIRDAKWLRIWSQMTELPPDMIEDYLAVTDASLRKPVSFELSRATGDSFDSVTTWLAYLHDLTSAIDGGVINTTDLKALQSRAVELLDALDSFENDQTTLGILGSIDAAASAGPAADGVKAPHLRAEYEPKFEGLLNTSDASIFAGRTDLKAIFAAVRAAKIDVTDTPLLANLNDRLMALVEAPEDPDNTRQYVVAIGPQQFTFDSKKWNQVVRNSRESEQVARFLRRRLTGSSIFFGAEIDAQIRPITWNADNDGTSMFLGKADIEARATRAAFDKYVLDPTFKASDTLDKTSVPADLKRALADLVKDQVSAYADEYRRQTAKFFRSFGIRASSPQELRVVLAQMVADNSPFASFLEAVDRQISATTGHPWMASMDEALADFATLHKVLDGSSGTPEIAKYKEILRALLADLGPATDSKTEAPAAPAPGADSRPTLESALSPAGMLTLKAVHGDKGSYAAMVRDWVTSVQLPELQQRPFLLPTEELIAIGLREIEREVARAWYRDAMKGLPTLMDKFPFDKAAADEVRMEDLQAFFDPQKGTFFDTFRRDFEPVADFGDGRPFRELPGLRGRMRFPGGMFPIVNAVASVSSRLYDAKGLTKPIDVRIGTVPFDKTGNAGTRMTLSYITMGDTTLFNFDQKPGITTVHWDWTREQSCQVGVQLTDIETRENKLPTPLALEASRFCLFRLFGKAQEAAPVRSEPGTIVYTWNPGTEKDGGARARFAAYGDALDVFAALAREVKAVHADREVGTIARP